MGQTAPYPESNDALGHPGTLRARMERDGCLFFRGLIDPEAIMTVRRAILAICRDAGWLAESTALLDGVAAPGVRHVEGEPGFWLVYQQVMKLEPFHALAHDAALLAMLRDLLGEEVLVHPRNIARIIFPHNIAYTTPAHQDYIHIQGTPETYTAWFPLCDCPLALGPLSVLAGSHRQGLYMTRASLGAGGRGVDTDALPFSWLEADFRLGDCVLFHSHALHRALDNQSPDRLRLSVDYRYQGVSQPVTEGSLLPHHGRQSWEEIYAGWSSDRYQYYWRRLPLRVVPFDRELYVRLDRDRAPALRSGEQG
jgi:ectoine hydroxylase-related dioxygenase (phytanoyl-CoA dioxygenase family)